MKKFMLSLMVLISAISLTACSRNTKETEVEETEEVEEVSIAGFWYIDSIESGWMNTFYFKEDGTLEQYEQFGSNSTFDRLIVGEPIEGYLAPEQVYEDLVNTATLIESGEWSLENGVLTTKFYTPKQELMTVVESTLILTDTLMAFEIEDVILTMRPAISLDDLDLEEIQENVEDTDSTKDVE